MAYYSNLYIIPYGIFLIVLFILFLNISARGDNKYILSIKLCIALIIFLLFIGFRGFIYTDWINYYPYFLSSPTIFSDISLILDFISTSKYNFGFDIYIILIKSITYNYFAFQAINLIFDLFLLILMLKQYFRDKHLILLSLIFVFLFGGVLNFGIFINLLRNSKSILLFGISLRYIKLKKPIIYILLNLFGCLFHSTSIIFIPLYYILSARINKFIIYALFVIGNMIFIFQIQWIRDVLLLFAESISSQISNLIIIYFRMPKYSSPYGLSVGYLERLFSFFVMIQYSDSLKKDPNYNVLLNNFYLYIFLYLYCSEISILLDRFALLFIFSYWVLFPKLYAILSKRKKAYFLVILLSYSFMKTISANSIFYYYENILFSKIDYEEKKEIIKSYSEYLDSFKEK